MQRRHLLDPTTWASRFCHCSLLVLGTLLVSCGSDSAGPPPVANAATGALNEDESYSSTLTGSDPQGRELTYWLHSQARHGHVQVDSLSGQFTYVPDQDYNGTDSFRFFVANGRTRSTAAVIEMYVAPVNDAPTLAEIAPRTNERGRYPMSIPLVGGDVDGDELRWHATSDDPRIASVEIDLEARSLLVYPRSRGTTQFRVEVSDGTATSSRAFEFNVREYSQVHEVALLNPEAQAIELINAGPIDTLVRLDVNWRMFPGNRDDILRRISRMNAPANLDSMPFRIWRALAENTRRGATLSESYWLHAPARVLNSTGFGYCDDLASAFAALLSEEGMEVRVWTLNGHVVPEVKVDGRWEMYDSDTGIIYYNDSNQIAGVEELMTDPTLITQPRGYIRATKLDDAFPFSDELAGIYSSVEDNQVMDGYTSPIPRADASIAMPAGATLVFGGVWSAPISDHPTGNPIPFRAEARLVLPEGWSGQIPNGMLVTSITGSGSVRVNSTVFAAGSAALQERLSNFDLPQRSIIIEHSDSDMDVTFLVNAVAGHLERVNRVWISSLYPDEITVRGFDLDSDHRVTRTLTADSAPAQDSGSRSEQDSQVTAE